MQSKIYLASNVATEARQRPSLLHGYFEDIDADVWLVHVRSKRTPLEREARGDETPILLCVIGILSNFFA